MAAVVFFGAVLHSAPRSPRACYGIFLNISLTRAHSLHRLSRMEKHPLPGPSHPLPGPSCGGLCQVKAQVLVSALVSVADLTVDGPSQADRIRRVDSDRKTRIRGFWGTWFSPDVWLGRPPNFPTKPLHPSRLGYSRACAKCWCPNVRSCPSQARRISSWPSRRCMGGTPILWSLGSTILSPKNARWTRNKSRTFRFLFSGSSLNSVEGSTCCSEVPYVLQQNRQKRPAGRAGRLL